MRRIVLIGLILVLLLVACGGNDNKETSLDQIVPNLTPREIIDTASPKLDEVESFHFELSQEGGGTPIAMGLEMTGVKGDIEPPDKLKMEIEAKWVGQFMEAELVTVGTITYMTNPLTGKWELLGEDFNAVTLFQPSTGIKAVMESLTDLAMLEAETVDKVLCFHLKGMIVSEVLDAIAVGHAAEGLIVKTDIWIGIDDFIFRKVVFDGRICKDENEGIVRVLALSKINEPVIIELPE